MSEHEIDEQMFLRQYYSKQLNEGSLKKLCRRQMKLQTTNKAAFDYLQIQQNQGDYNEGKPFHIVVPDRPIVISKPMDEPSQMLIQQTPNYSRQQFESETMLNVSDRKVAEDETQPTEPVDKIQHQTPAAPQVIIPKTQKHLVNNAKRQCNKSLSPDKTRKRKPYTKVPFHGLYFKRHIKSPRSVQQSRSPQDNSQKLQVSNLFLNQILSLKDEQLSSLEESQIKNLNIILEQRLIKHTQHYKELIKQKFYVEANNIVKKIYDRRKIHDSQLMKIAQLEDTKLRQSFEYQKSVCNSICVLKEKIKALTKHNKQLAVRVFKNQQTEKKVEKRQKMLEFINDMTWQKVTTEKEIKSRAAHLQKIQTRMVKINQLMNSHNSRLDQLLVQMKQLLEIQKSQVNCQKISASTLKTPVEKPKSKRSVSSGKIQPKTNSNLSRLTNIFYKMDRSVKTVEKSVDKVHEKPETQGRYSDNEQTSYAAQTDEQKTPQNQHKKLYYIKLPSVTLSHSLNIPHNPEQKYDSNLVSPFKTMKKTNSEETPYVFGEGTINGWKRKFFKSSNSQLNLMESSQLTQESPRKTEQFDKLVEDTIKKIEQSPKREESPKKRFRTRNLTEASIEIIKEVDELNELGSIANSQRLKEPRQSSNNSRRFEMRSGTQSEDIGQNQYIPLRSKEIPEWLAS